MTFRCVTKHKEFPLRKYDFSLYSQNINVFALFIHMSIYLVVFIHVKFRIFAMEMLQIVLFWLLTPFSPVGGYQCCLHFQG